MIIFLKQSPDMYLHLHWHIIILLKVHSVKGDYEVYFSSSVSPVIYN